MRNLVTASTMLAVAMSTIDATIANVAMPHMQGSLSAGQDQITWVLTSYIVAQTLMTPLISWVSGRIGRKNLMLLSVAAFTAASLAVGVSGNLAEMVFFRLIQGAACAPFGPLAQAIMYDINEPKDHPKAMALFGAGIMIGPIIGPVLGGWITDTLDWRWCFLINLPLGVLAFAGIWVSMPTRQSRERPPLDFLGFGAIALLLGSMQLMLDRGPGQDWFGSREIWIYLALSLIGLHVFVVQTLMGKTPFFSPRLLGDRNFMLGSGFGFLLGALVFSATALMPGLLQSLLHLPAFDAGIAMAPRGIGMMIAMWMSGRMSGKVSDIAVIAFGFAVNAVSMAMMTGLSLEMDTSPIILIGFLQGFGTGFVFVSMTTLAFSTVPGELRAEAASIYNLMRNLGSAVGISIMQAIFVQNIQVAHSGMAEHARVDNPNIQGMPFFDLGTTTGAMTFDAEIYRQATLMAYLDDFKIAMFLSLFIIPFLLFLRKPKGKPMERPDVHFE